MYAILTTAETTVSKLPYKSMLTHANMTAVVLAISNINLANLKYKNSTYIAGKKSHEKSVLNYCTNIYMNNLI